MPALTDPTIAEQIISNLLSGLTEILSAVPQAIVTAFTNMFLNSGGTTLNTFAIVMLVFGGIALAFGITKLVYNLVARKVGA